MVSLYNDDCIKVLKELPSESVDLIVTDLAYKVTSRGNCGTMGGFWKEKQAMKGKIFEHNNIDSADYFPLLYKCLKEKSLCYVMTNNVNLIDMLNNAVASGFHFVKSLIWEKGNKICGRYYMGCFEYILLFRKGGDRPINNCSTPDILKVPIHKIKDENGKNLHDTEKPVDLMKILIENSSLEGDTVLDCFMGIGSTGIASKELKRNFIGIELNKKYFDIAKERIGKENE